MLWFDVESRYEATACLRSSSAALLWFDVESRYEATTTAVQSPRSRCGLM